MNQNNESSGFKEKALYGYTVAVSQRRDLAYAQEKKKQKTLEINTLSFLASPPLLESPVEWGSAVVRDLA